MSPSRFDRTPWLGLLLIVLSGCMSYRIEQPFQLNTPLYYLSWEDCFNEQAPAKCKQDLQCLAREEYPRRDGITETRATAPKDTIRLWPGVKLIVHNAPLRAHGRNTQAPALSMYEWIIPRQDSYSQRDLFFASYIMATGVPETGSSDSSVTLKQLGSNLQEPHFFEQFAREVLTPSISSLSLVSTRSGHRQADACRAGGVREWLTKPSKSDFSGAGPEDPPPAQQFLQASFPISENGDISLVTFKAFEGSSGFFYEEVGTLTQANEKNRWYTPGAQNFEAHAYLEVEVPVRIESEAASRYFPVYWSVRDLEKTLGVYVIGVRRHGALLPDLEAGTRKWCVENGKIKKSCLQASDGFFTICFRGCHYGFRAARYLAVKDDLKEDLLLAAGDVVILGRRSTTFDRPEIR